MYTGLGMFETIEVKHQQRPISGWQSTHSAVWRRSRSSFARMGSSLPVSGSSPSLVVRTMAGRRFQVRAVFRAMRYNQVLNLASPRKRDQPCHSLQQHFLLKVLVVIRMNGVQACYPVHDTAMLVYQP